MALAELLASLRSASWGQRHAVSSLQGVLGSGDLDPTRAEEIKKPRGGTWGWREKSYQRPEGGVITK